MHEQFAPVRLGKRLKGIAIAGPRTRNQVRGHHVTVSPHLLRHLSPSRHEPRP
jgi:hypothetical protein